jgi:hypothetical protein
MTSCWWRLIHPAKDTSSSRKRETSAVICRSYCSPAGGCRTTGSAEYSDTTAFVKCAAEKPSRASAHRRKVMRSEHTWT